jgi:hypothetical protein
MTRLKADRGDGSLVIEITLDEGHAGEGAEGCA